ncbi:MAG TPA: carboxypeptidase-like regulatory domain-containing protein, partial [Pyrinomonadaceae bacterium]|nr:carboxypeptidase-like regulatory domain-containing protein [Pyrinomonadaceae bacterium]
MFTFTACPNRTKRTPYLTDRIGEKQSPPARMTLRWSVQCLGLLVLTVLLVPTAIRAQVLYGALVGTVTDPNGAAVSGAKVELTNLATGTVSSTTTDDNGSYKINDLQVGTYKVTITGASFKTTINENVPIEAN